MQQFVQPLLLLLHYFSIFSPLLHAACAGKYSIDQKLSEMQLHLEKKLETLQIRDTEYFIGNTRVRFI